MYLIMGEEYVKFQDYLRKEREKERQLSLGENNKELSTTRDSTIDYNVIHFK